MASRIEKGEPVCVTQGKTDPRAIYLGDIRRSDSDDDDEEYVSIKWFTTNNIEYVPSSSVRRLDMNDHRRRIGPNRSVPAPSTAAPPPPARAPPPPPPPPPPPARAAPPPPPPTPTTTNIEEEEESKMAVVPPPAPPKSADQDVIFNSPAPVAQVTKTKNHKWKLGMIQKHKQKFEPTIAFINNTNKPKAKAEAKNNYNTFEQEEEVEEEEGSKMASNCRPATPATHAATHAATATTTAAEIVDLVDDDSTDDDEELEYPRRYSFLSISNKENDHENSNSNGNTATAIPAPSKSADPYVVFKSPPSATQVKKTKNYEPPPPPRRWLEPNQLAVRAPPPSPPPPPPPPPTTTTNSTTSDEASVQDIVRVIPPTSTMQMEITDSYLSLLVDYGSSSDEDDDEEKENINNNDDDAAIKINLLPEQSITAPAVFSRRRRPAATAATAATTTAAEIVDLVDDDSTDDGEEKECWTTDTATAATTTAATTTAATTTAPAAAATAAATVTVVAKPAANTKTKYKYMQIVSFYPLKENKGIFPSSYEIEKVLNPCPNGDKGCKDYFQDNACTRIERYKHLRRYKCHCARPIGFRLGQDRTDATKWTIDIDVYADKMKLYHVPLNAADDRLGLPIFKATEMQKIQGLWQKYHP